MSELTLVGIIMVASIVCASCLRCGADAMQFRGTQTAAAQYGMFQYDE